MLVELPYRRILVLTEGLLGTFTSKTAVCLLRYRPNDVVGVLDRAHAGQPLRSLIDGVGDVPILASVSEALSSLPERPNAVVIGVAPVGGALPGPMRQHVIDALRSGLSIISGLHAPLHRDPELAQLAERHHARIHDVRDPGPIERIACGLARQTRVKRVLTVGTDCNVGKMVTAYELRDTASKAGLDAAFVATGQTGIMLEGWGIAIDHVLSDFTAGAVEMLVEQVAHRQICFIEGQGSIAHPGYSGVTLSLLHGACPDVMVVCHRPNRDVHSGWADCPVAPVAEQIALYEKVLEPLYPAKVVAVALNTVGMPDEAAVRTLETITNQTGLPTTDPIRWDCQPLLVAVRQYLGI